MNEKYTQKELEKKINFHIGAVDDMKELLKLKIKHLELELQILNKDLDNLNKYNFKS